MKGLFARIRWRLVGWNMLILGLILVLLGTSVYAALSRSLLDEVDRNLLSRSEQAQAIFGPRRPGDPPVLVASSEKIQRELGWRPRFTDLRAVMVSYASVTETTRAASEISPSRRPRG